MQPYDEYLDEPRRWFEPWLWIGALAVVCVPWFVGVWAIFEWLR